MKANNGKGNNEARDEWQTPNGLFNLLNAQYNFNYDCCASQSNAKCEFFSSKRLPLDLSTRIKGVCWMNPPFSQASKMFEDFFKIVESGVAIYRCDNMETRIWQEIIFPNACWVFIPDRRIVYYGLDGTGARFPSALIGFNVRKITTLGGITLLPSLHSGN